WVRNGKCELLRVSLRRFVFRILFKPPHTRAYAQMLISDSLLARLYANHGHRSSTKRCHNLALRVM
ncbi:MAG: hypothetical protein Q7J23_03430, partial [Nitrosomonas sp.]|nr:hypothetical protein [Nitrosomonas sp.]